MKQKMCLPFENSPYSLMYNGSAFASGIIQGNADKDITPWLCSKYINCWFAESFKVQFAYYIGDHWPEGDGILFHQKIDLCPDQYNYLYKKDILHLFRKMLSLGCYVHGRYNEEFIHGKSSYGKQYYDHNFLLIGYDNIAQNFISAGYLKYGKFQRYNIPYTNMRQAIESYKSDKLCYHFWKYNNEAAYSLNFSRLIGDISDYIYSTTSAKIYTKNREWGMNAFYCLGDFFSKACDDGLPIDIRYTRGQMEHKFFMQMRMEYLFNEGYLKKNEYFQHAKKVHKMSETVHMLGLKYNMTGRQYIVKNILDIMHDMIAVEKEYLPLVLAELNAYSEGRSL